MCKKKMDAIRNEKPLNTRKGLRRFLGITNYDCKFIKGYSTIARPLHKLTKDVPFEWMHQCQEVFKELREALITAPVLALPADTGKFHPETDASDIVTGAVLYQMQNDRGYRPVGYASKLYSEAEKGYTTYDKEMLGVMRGLEDWRNLLIGTSEPFKIMTDHQNLTYFREPQKLTLRQVNWMTKLQDYNFMIKHIKGNNNTRADALSGLEGVEKGEHKTAMLLPESYFV
jgi:hypothetical protein